MADGFSVTMKQEIRRSRWTSIDLLSEDGLRRHNQEDDELFYAAARKRPFFGDNTDRALRRHHERILQGGARRVLDLMSSLTSHLPSKDGGEVVGLGLNADELRLNPALSEVVVHDLNRDPRLPFDGDQFDAVLCSGSVDLLTRPLEVFRDVARVLRKGGVFIVSFTDRFIQPKAIEAWKEESSRGRLMLTTAYFSFSGAFLRPFVQIEELDTPSCVAAGPGASLGDESLTVVWGYRPPATKVVETRPDPLERIANVSERHCPYCSTRMSLWQPPETPWEIDYNASLLYVCFNDECAYFTRGAQWCRVNGMRCSSYRHSRNPATGSEGPLPVPVRGALRSGIVEED